MPKIQHLQNAPIEEAIIDIRVQLPEGRNLSQLNAMTDLIHEDYPNTRIRHSWAARFSIQENSPTLSDAETTPDGYMCRSEDGIRIVQSRLDGFTLSFLRPYSTWDDLKTEARRLWKLYVDVAEPTTVERIAVRYINHIPIPVGRDLRAYVLTNFDIAPELPQKFTSFLLRITLQYPEPAAQVIVTQNLLNQIESGTVPLVFDIDVFRSCTLSAGDSDNMWSQFDELRNIKNEVFFKSITTEALELFR